MHGRYGIVSHIVNWETGLPELLLAAKIQFPQPLIALMVQGCDTIKLQAHCPYLAQADYCRPKSHQFMLSGCEILYDSQG